MRVIRSLVYKIGVPLCLTALGCLVFVQSKGLANDGPLDPITPYKEGTSITPQDIETVRTHSSSFRVITDVQTKGSKAPIFGRRVGFAFVTDNGKVEEIDFNLRGTAESGGDVTVPLSDVKSFTILKVKHSWFSWFWFARDRALLNVTVFPSISPSELLQSGPTYSQLTESYTRQMRMWIFLEDKNKSQLSMVGKKWGFKYEVLFAIQDLELNVPVVLDWPDTESAPIWWAVESVIKDDKYPYRVKYGL